MKTLRLTSIAAVLMLVAIAPASASTGGPVGHDQAFVGRVNGRFDRATIAMACFGPVQPGESGHPLPGQMLDVLSPLPPIAVGPIHPGNTGGSANRIVAVLRGATPVILARFTNYFQTEAIPTSVELPCAGTGVVRFVPKPKGPTASAAWVTVSFVGQP